MKKDLKDWSGAFSVDNVVYQTMQHASIARLHWTALKNVPKLNKRSSSGWADLARATGITQPKIRRDGKARTGRLSSGVSERIYQMCRRGTLPKDPEQLRKLLEIAGSPWKEEFGNEVQTHS